MKGRPAVVRPPVVAVIGDGDPRGPEAHRLLEWAEEVGQHLARGGATVVTGGLGGVMRAASRERAGPAGRPSESFPAQTHPRRTSSFVFRLRPASASFATSSSSPPPMPSLRSEGGTARYPRSALPFAWAGTW